MKTTIKTERGAVIVTAAESTARAGMVGLCLDMGCCAAGAQIDPHAAMLLASELMRAAAVAEQQTEAAAYLATAPQETTRAAA